MNGPNPTATTGTSARQDGTARRAIPRADAWLSELQICPTSSDRPPALSGEKLPALAKALAAQVGNFDRFVQSCENGTILQQVLALTDERNFLRSALTAGLRDATLRNKLVEILHGSKAVREWEYVPLLGILLEHYTRVPNEANRAHLAAAQDTLTDLGSLIARIHNFAQFANRAMGLNTPTQIQGNDVVSHGIKIGATANGAKVTPQALDPNTTVVGIGGQNFYNGLPGDRGRFPSLPIPSGSTLGLTFTNTTDRVLMVIPTVNGIPLRAERILLGVPGFESSDLPLLEIKPHRVYIEPGETFDCAEFACGRIQLTDQAAIRDYYSTLDFGNPSVLLPLIGPAFMRNLPPVHRELLAADKSPEERAYLNAAVHQAKERYVERLLRMLNQGFAGSWRCDVVVGKPVIADSADSDSLSNPMLGTIGCAVFEVRPPERRPNFSTPVFNDLSFAYRGGAPATRGLGGVGLAPIGGSSAFSGAALDSWNHPDGIHKFMGYVTLNLLATTGPRGAAT